MATARKQLEDKVNQLSNSDDKQLLLEILKREAFNEMFRKASMQSGSLTIMGFLYLHKDEFKLNVNAKGKLKKSALEFAIENDSKENVLFLLKLKEVEADDNIRDKINLKFGMDFRKNNIAPRYVPLGDKLVKLDQEVSKLTENYSNNLEALTKKAFQDLSSIISNLKSSLIPTDEISQTNINCLNVSRNLASQCENIISSLSPVYDDYEKTFHEYLPYNYAQEKLLYGNEVAKSNLNSTMINTCLKNRLAFEETIRVIERNRFCIITLIEELFSNLILTEILFNPSSKEEIEHEPKLSTYLPSLKDNESTQIIHEPKEIFPQTIQKEIELPKPGLSNNTNNISKKTKPATGKKINSNTKPETNQSNNVSPNPKIERLKNLADDLTHLKQKGQVKLSVFLSLIAKIGKEIDIELSKSKKGYVVNQSNNHFSFHTPHKKDKGVDKSAVADMEKLLKNEIHSRANLGDRK